MDSRSAQVRDADALDSVLHGIDQATLDALFSAAYEELRRLAAIEMPASGSSPGIRASPTDD